MKATEQYFPEELFIMLYKVVITFESVDEILKHRLHTCICLFFFIICLITSTLLLCLTLLVLVSHSTFIILHLVVCFVAVKW